MNKNQHILLVKSENKPGVLNKIASLCRRRRYNMESLTVGATNVPNISHFTIVLSGLKKDRIDQTVNQINKIVEVTEIEAVEPKEVVDKELVLLTLKDEGVVNKMKSDAAHMASIRVLNTIRGRPVVEIVGSGTEIEHILSKLDMSKEVVQMARSGLVALRVSGKSVDTDVVNIH